jgi:hypothetical protein
MKKLSSVTALAMLLSQNAMAIDYPAKGHNYIVCEASTLVLEEGHSLTLIKGKGFGTITNPPSHVECYGTVESMPDKSFKASGYCVHTDRDGDKIADRWWADSSMPKGKWEDVGISGKWKGVRKSGNYVYTDLSTPTDCRGVSNWEVEKQ